MAAQRPTGVATRREFGGHGLTTAAGSAFFQLVGKYELGGSFTSPYPMYVDLMRKVG
jgi:hypothetical protein